MFKKYAILLLSVALLGTGLRASAQAPRAGQWRGILHLNDSMHADLPFNFELKRDKGHVTINIRNWTDRIVCTEVRETSDSLNWKIPVFDTYFICAIKSDTLFTGYWINNARTTLRNIRFEAHYGKDWRFLPPTTVAKDPPFYPDGKWQAMFSPGVADSSAAVGDFVSEGNKVFGTFLTETGDYRFLEGNFIGNNLYLSTFDGAHAFLFKAQVTGKKMTGTYWSGIHWFEPFVAERNDSAHLRDANKLTYVSDSTLSIQFTYLNDDRMPVSYSDPRYKGKVVILQVMGSWCPNCLDETKVLSELYKANQSKGLEIIGLDFEHTDDLNQACANVKRMKARYGTTYEVLITGRNNKREASEALPFLNGIMAFPTTVYIDKKGRIRRVYTGFNGLATGKVGMQQDEEMKAFVAKLLAE